MRARGLEFAHRIANARFQQEMGMQSEMTAYREAWVDYAKGICILLVVMMHSTLGVEAAAGKESWMHLLVAFAEPFRMPDFFLVAGLFLARRIDWEWQGYLDRKVVHFLYFYLLWLAIQFALKAPIFIADAGLGGAAFAFLESFVQPFGTLWFIYLLPVLFVVTKALKDVPPLLVFCVGAALETAAPATGITVFDYFCAYFVYFFAGYWLAPHIFEFAKSVAGKPAVALACLSGWAVLNGYYVFNGLAEIPLVT
ncbi:MAG: acyltransferase family protein, partial [Pirellulales bacterium]|nr:acyltransferase family protein [Pirellulales bacterium]